MKQVSAAFVKAQKQFGPALKSHTNPHFKSKYADLSACVEAVIDALNDNGIGLVQRTHPDETGVTVETVLMHESGESISSGTLHVPAAKMDPQGYGSALTYARRYSLMAACGIAPEDDDGNAAAKAKPAERFGDKQPNFPRVADVVLADEPAIDADTAAAVAHLASIIKEEFPKIGPKGCANLVQARKLDTVGLLTLSNQLPTPMRNALKTAMAANHQQVPA